MIVDFFWSTQRIGLRTEWISHRFKRQTFNPMKTELCLVGFPMKKILPYIIYYRWYHLYHLYHWYPIEFPIEFPYCHHFLPRKTSSPLERWRSPAKTPRPVWPGRPSVKWPSFGSWCGRSRGGANHFTKCGDLVGFFRDVWRYLWDIYEIFMKIFMRYLWVFSGMFEDMGVSENVVYP